ncbi:MAG: hypothetical protein ACYCWW_15810 [Deltaproteobacteria bacterium]
MANNGSSSTGSNVNPQAQKSAPKGLYLAFTLLKQGVDSVIPSKSSVMVGGQSYTQAQLSSKLASAIAIFQAVVDSHNQLKAAVLARAAAVPGLKLQYADIKKAIEAQLGSGSPVLVQFGIHAPKPKAKLTAAQLALRAAKASLTRAARHTLGRKQKLEIKTVGTPSVTISPTGKLTSQLEGSPSTPVGAGNSSPPTGTGSTTTGGNSNGAA